MDPGEGEGQLLQVGPQQGRSALWKAEDWNVSCLMKVRRAQAGSRRQVLL